MSQEGTKSEIDFLIREFFHSVSFELSGRPSYERIAELCIDSALLINNTMEFPQVMTVAEFVSSRSVLFKSGALRRFNEIELWSETEIFGNIAHRLSGYAKSGTRSNTPFQAKGVISTQFVRTPSGWKMSAMAWDDEDPMLPGTKAHISR